MIYVIRNGVLLPIAGMNFSSTQVPTGTIIWFPSNSIPFGWLLCDGSSYNTVTYSALHDILQSDYLPDFREVSLVGIGERTDGLAHDVFGLLEFKDEQLGAHNHTWPSTWVRREYTRNAIASWPGSTTVANSSSRTEYTDTLASGGDHTRQKSVGLNVIIKW